MKQQQSVFSRSREISDMAVTARYLVTTKITVVSKPLNEDEFVKTCMLKTSDSVTRVTIFGESTRLTSETIV